MNESFENFSKFKNNQIISFYMNFLLLSSCFQIPHPSKVLFGGEDACFVSKKNSAVGVADGVGGWSNIPGSNSAKYSHDLMDYSKEYSYLPNPLDILENAYEKVDKTIVGSTTATIAKLNDNNLSIINVGDSGCHVYREFKNIFQTKTTSHRFNFPYQLGFQSNTVPSNGTLDSLLVYSSDIIVCASDGLWDNVYNSDIEQLLYDAYEADLNPKVFTKRAAKKLAEMAYKNSEDKEFDSPFVKEAINNGIYFFSGGKPDDVTVVVSIVDLEK
ncbi:putative protein phosphatase 2C 1 [Tritrichomonas foetus]|uniref:Protein phosphatase n=1 Tax=Tritrichomonas foetus TaxID=1144522 RepID=A0A1J4KBU2_9EUKA|nr:putative protein phosphatase 2C 1 [Tritrichomonas foetus]|eukprot:OHT07150.1 putative protein phosphatase 2C 1 [Tritrichomonas foetus]